MRKYAFIATLAAATCIALTGCTAGPTLGTDGIDEIPDSDWQIHFNRETGKITAIFDHADSEGEIYRDDTFNQKEDLALPFYYGSSSYSQATEVDSTLTISDKDYPTTLTVGWSFGSTNWEQQAIYYNEHIASAETMTELEQLDPLEPFSLTSSVVDFVGQGMSSSTVPTPRFATSGEATIHYGPDYLVQGYANGVAPKDLVLQHTGTKPDPNVKYTYTFGCAVYKIALVNGEELQQWIDQLPVNADGVDIWFTTKDDAVVPTEAPCDISQKGQVGGEQPKEDSNNTGDNPGGSNG